MGPRGRLWRGPRRACDGGTVVPENAKNAKNATDAKNAKRTLRAALLGRRAALGPELIRARSRRLTERLFDLREWREAEGVAAFIGVGGEPETWALLSATLGAGKRLALPRVCRRPPEGGRSRLDFVLVDDLGALVRARFGLWEPSVGERPERRSTSPGEALGIDLVLVPGVGFDRQGRRLGFGMGYYDRALASLRRLRSPRRIGIAFEEAVDPEEGSIPTDEHDVPMHALLTEEGLSRC